MWWLATIVYTGTQTHLTNFPPTTELPQQGYHSLLPPTPGVGTQATLRTFKFLSDGFYLT
mgnify:CR=1 FL=1